MDILRYDILESGLAPRQNVKKIYIFIKATLILKDNMRGLNSKHDGALFELPNSHKMNV